MIRLVNIRNYEEAERHELLWEMLGERTPAQAISHAEMPDWVDHKVFVDNHPYGVWYFIAEAEDYDTVYGNIYLTNNREIGVSVLACYRNKGIATQALKEVFRIHKGPFLANINPDNHGSMKFFEKHGFKHIQNTLKLEDDDAASR